MDTKKSIYIETSIPSFMAARTSSNVVIAGKQAVTHEFWESERQNYNLYVSVFVHEECSKGDPNVSKKRLDYLKDITILANTPDIEPLADVYMHLLSIPQRSRVDALHLAMCCVHSIDILLSWNCTHLVNIENMLRIQKQNDACGLFTPRMITPDFIVDNYMEVEINE